LSHPRATVAPQISARAATRAITSQISKRTAPRAVRTSSMMRWISNGGRSSAPTPIATASDSNAAFPRYGFTKSPSRHKVLLAGARVRGITLRSEGSDFSRLLLLVDQRMKEAAELEQLLVRAALPDSAPIENDDAVYTL